MPGAKPENRFDEKPDEAPARPCPICGRRAAFTDRPFCSKRCADVDLHRWLGGVYAVPASPDRDAESDGAGKQ
ncbi:MAG: DNA gyrase inhibitor YacG [Methylocella sp.]